MSDFDKEAERQRLREKYEEDEADREVTQQMSELLLRGATMTNKHCDRCQNPIFRYEGDEFCPVCQGAVEGQRAADAEAAADTGAEAEAQAGESAAATAGTPSVGGQSAPETAEAGQSPDRTQPTERSQAEGAQSTEQAETAQRAQSPERTAPAADPGDLGEARASLARTLTDLAGRAESAGDVGRQRDLLAAAREAAEAIEALDRAR